MVSISEPISNHFLLSLLILIPGLLSIKYLPWHKLINTTIAINDRQITITKDNTILPAKLIISILTIFISLSIFSEGLSEGYVWLKFPSLGLAITAVLITNRPRQEK